MCVYVCVRACAHEHICMPVSFSNDFIDWEDFQCPLAAGEASLNCECAGVCGGVRGGSVCTCFDVCLYAYTLGLGEVSLHFARVCVWGGSAWVYSGVFGMCRPVCVPVHSGVCLCAHVHTHACLLTPECGLSGPCWGTPAGPSVTAMYTEDPQTFLHPQQPHQWPGPLWAVTAICPPTHHLPSYSPGQAAASWASPTPPSLPSGPLTHFSERRGG